MTTPHHDDHPKKSTRAGATPAPAALTGREPTLDTPPLSVPDQASSGVTGRETTRGTPPIDATVSGREPTLQTPTGGVTGREPTLEIPAVLVTPTGLNGRETTLKTPPVEPLTIHGSVGPTPMTPAGTGSSTRPRSGGTSGFDEAWVLHAGRAGSFTGQTWGDFAIGGLLGEGGMGAVYRAWQRSLKRRVALKVLPSNMSGNTRLLSRFRLEATSASKLQSAHVVQVYAIGEHEGHHYYAMEYVEGKDVHDIIRERREAKQPITPTEAADYILQAAKGLVEAGVKGIIHRDIKPPNLLVTTDGTVKIADFGIVKVLGEHHVTMTGQAVGTPAYVSPEQGRGDRELDTRSDLYSLGVVFYELACGVRPFDGNTPNALIYQHCYEEPRLPRELNPAITPEIQAIILRCLQKKPDGRYQSAAELVRDLNGIRTGNLVRSAVAHYQLSTGAKEAKREQMNWLQRHLLPVAAASLIIIAGGVGGGWWIVDQKQKATLARERQSLVGEKAVADQRTALAATLDAVAPIAEDIDDQLTIFSQRAPAGEQDRDLLRWRAKVSNVRELETKLAPLSSGTANSVTRRTGRADLDALIAKIGPGVPATERAKNRLDALDAEEARLRIICAQIDTTALRLDERRRFGDQLASLTALAATDDPQIVKWKTRLAAFDSELAVLRARIAPLDEAKQITIAERNLHRPALTELRSYLDENDADLLRWRDKLEGADRRITQLREDIVAVVGPQPERIPKAKQAQIADKLADLQSLVGVDDPQVKDWLNAIAGTDRTITGARQRLAERAKDSGDGVIPQPGHAAFERDVQILASFAAEGDTERLAYEQQLADSRRQLDGLRMDCVVLEPTATPLSVTEQKSLTIKVERLVAKGALDPERTQNHRARLAAEEKRVAELRRSLTEYDVVTPVTSAMDMGLERLTKDVGKEDPDVLRWLRKRDRVRALQSRLGELDRQTGVPDQVEVLFAELESLVGQEDLLLRGWRDKVSRILGARATLRVLDQRVSYDDAEIRKRLADLVELSGTSDRKVQSWQAKVTEVAQLKAALAKLDGKLALPQADHAMAHEHLQRLATALVGSDDPQVRRAAIRLSELDGPAQPTWASQSGRDSHGLWADARFPGGILRFRLIASGTFVMGSRDQEVGRKADELPVRVTLPRAFWMADSETPRAVWSAVMGNDPSWTSLFDAATQPVERMTWSEAQTFCTTLSNSVPGLNARLPMEAEWEYACRGGSIAAWDIPEGLSSSLDGISKLAWHRGNTGEGAHASRGRLPNSLGLYDLHGNLSEWCADGYAPYPTIESIITTPATGTERRVLRGGSWGDSWLKTRSANRINAAPEIRSAYVGMRVVAEVDWNGHLPDGVALLAHMTSSMQSEEAPRMHRITAGETISSLAAGRIGDPASVDSKALSLSELALLAANPWMSTEQLRSGQPLPIGAWAVVPPRSWRVHVVQTGESLVAIASTHTGTTPVSLIRANPWLGPQTNLVQGMILLLPIESPGTP